MPSKVDEYSKTSQKVDARSPSKASLLAPAYLSIRAGQEGWLEERGRSAGSDSDNVIVVGNQPEASRCMLLYDIVSLDREILARQDH